MAFSQERLIRTIGTSVVAFSSALLGFIFNLETNLVTINYFIIIMLVLIIGGAMACYEKRKKCR